MTKPEASPSTPRRTRLLRGFARHYGAGPLHLVGLLGCFAFAGYIVDRVTTVNDPIGIAIWFAAALVSHDLFFFPLYTLVDWANTSMARRRHEARGIPPRVPWTNHVRVPVLVSGMLLLISFPLVFKVDTSDYRNATGLNLNPYLARWLLITAALFVASAIIYAIRLGRAGRTTPPQTEHKDAPAGPRR